MLGQADTEVDGADSATLLEYSFHSEGAPVHSWDVVAEGPDGEQVIFRVAGSEDILDEDTAERILDTLSFKIASGDDRDRVSTRRVSGGRSER